MKAGTENQAQRDAASLQMILHHPTWHLTVNQNIQNNDQYFQHLMHIAVKNI